MPAERLPMRKIRNILRLRWGCGLSSRQIAVSQGIARSTVADYLGRAEAGGIGWPLADDMDETTLEARIFLIPQLIPMAERPLPDWSWVHQELHQKNVTLFLLWQKYRERCPRGYRYSRFCDLYRVWAGRQSVWML